MIKLLRDSIFKPKNLISYRAKKGLFVFFYVLMIAAIGALSYITEPLSFKGLEYSDKLTIVQDMKYKNAYIENGTFYGDTLNVTVGEYIITFIDSSKELKSASDATLIVKGNIAYLVSNTGTNINTMKIGTLSDLSSYFNESIVFGSAFNEESTFFTAINDIVSTYKPYIIIVYFMVGLVSSAITMLGFGFLNYLYLSLAFNAKRFMKKDQLYKMLVFASTAIVFGDMFIKLLNVPTIIAYFIIFVSFIPEFILEREIIKRIRIKIYGDSIINNEDVINKINEMIKNKQEEKENEENTVEDEYDDTEDSTDEDSEE